MEGHIGVRGLFQGNGFTTWPLFGMTKHETQLLSLSAQWTNERLNDDQERLGLIFWAILCIDVGI